MYGQRQTDSQFHSKTLSKQIAYIKQTTTHSQKKKRKQRKVRNQNQTISNLKKDVQIQISNQKVATSLMKN